MSNLTSNITIGTIITLYDPAKGRHWFDKATIRFFKTRFHQCYRGEGGTFFVTSEQNEGRPRAYSVRQFIPSSPEEDAHIETIGRYQGYATADDAARVAKKLSETKSEA